MARNAGDDRQPPTAFDESQIQSAYPDGIERHYWHIVRNRVLEYWLERLNLGGKRLLEVGCGKGLVVRHLVQKGFDCDGVELARVSPLPDIRDRIQTGRRAEDLSSDARASVRALLLLDVIEHLPDPEEFLAALTRVFPSVSHVLVTVPARAELWSHWDDYYGHYRRYDIPALRRLADHVPGIRLTGARYFFHLLYVPIRLVNLIRRKRSVVVTAPGGLARLLHSLLARLFLAEYHLLPGRLRGASLIASFEVSRATVKGAAGRSVAPGPPPASRRSPGP